MCGFALSHTWTKLKKDWIMIGIKPDHFPVFGRFMDTNFYLWTIIFIHGQEVLSGEKEIKNCNRSNFVTQQKVLFQNFTNSKIKLYK
jgi:hypothetical protein